MSETGSMGRKHKIQGLKKAVVMYGTRIVTRSSICRDCDVMRYSTKTFNVVDVFFWGRHFCFDDA